jgi:ribosome-associated protein
MDLHVAEGFVIPESELSWRFLPSGGPGGQHANRSATRAELTVDLSASGAADEATISRVLARLGTRAVDGVVTVAVDESRSQWRNRQIARARMADLLRDAMRVDPPRRRSRPSRAQKKRRVDDKRRRGRVKELRRRPEPE